MGAGFDVIVVGGGVVGSAVAYFLAAEPGFHGSVLVVEKDPTYATASTSLSVGGIRQQFSVRENIEISRFAVRFLDGLDEHLRVDDPVDVSFIESGYLFLATEKGLGSLKGNHQVQTELGAPVGTLYRDALKDMYPWMNTEDIAAGSLGRPGAGWLDPYGLLQAFKKKARALGVTYVSDEVVGLEREGSAITGATLRSGDRLSCEHVVNAAGPKAALVADMAGIDDLPVRPKKRCVFQFECGAKLPTCPLVIDPTGVYFRPEGKGFICGVSPDESNDSDAEDFNVDFALFEEKIWPVLANRVPAFESLRRTHSWAGHYAVNTRDHNAIIGPHPEVENFYFANGFSGHGLQQAPAVGRAISELIVHGAYQTLDLTRLGFHRFATGELIRELNVV